MSRAGGSGWLRALLSGMVARRVAALAMALAMGAPTALGAQSTAAGFRGPGDVAPRRTDGESWLFPGVRYFRRLFADPFDPRLSIGLIRTSLFETRGPERLAYTRSPGRDTEVQAAPSIGMTFPVFRLAGDSAAGITIGAQAAVFARFRIEHPSRDDLGQDWFVGMPIEAAWGTSSSLRVRLIHRSSHLGDEFSANTGARRIEFGGEAFDLLVARGAGGLRFYGGAGWIFHSNTASTAVLQTFERPDRYTAQAGLDGEWHPFADGRIAVQAGIDWQSAERTAWRPTWALAGGLRANVGRGVAGLVIRHTGGRSTLGQFFLTQEEVWTVEVGLAGS